MGDQPASDSDHPARLWGSSESSTCFFCDEPKVNTISLHGRKVTARFAVCPEHDDWMRGPWS